MHQSDFKDKTIEEKLDMFLGKVKNGTLHFPINTVGEPQYIDADTYYEILEYLQKEGLIKSDQANRGKYLLTIKGMVFDGFANQKERISRESKQTKNLAIGQFWLTLVLAVGSIGLVVFEALKYFHIYPCYCH